MKRPFTKSSEHPRADHGRAAWQKVDDQGVELYLRLEREGYGGGDLEFLWLFGANSPSPMLVLEGVAETVRRIA